MSANFYSYKFITTHAIIVLTYYDNCKNVLKTRGGKPASVNLVLNLKILYVHKKKTNMSIYKNDKYEHV